MIELDNLHYDFRQIDGYNKAFNFIMSPRELGKTTMFWLKKAYLQWKKNKKPWIYCVRQSVEICEALINTITDTILNKFTDDNVELEYKKGSFKEGITDVYIKGERFFRIIALKIDMQRIKKAGIKNVAGVVMDEYIVNPKLQEKYLVGEADKIKEAYTTWNREADGFLRWYFLGNPYSLFNPMFLYWKVDTNKLKPNEFYVGNDYVIHTPTLSEELKAKVLAKNPLYQFDEDYMQYALLGKPINDKNIKLGELPQNFQLRYVFFICNKYLGVFSNTNITLTEDRFYIKELESVSKYRSIWCFDFDELLEGVQLLSREERFMFARLKDSFRRRQISFSNINVYYLFKEVYQNL